MLEYFARALIPALERTDRTYIFTNPSERKRASFKATLYNGVDGHEDSFILI